MVKRPAAFPRQKGKAWQPYSISTLHIIKCRVGINSPNLTVFKMFNHSAVILYLTSLETGFWSNLTMQKLHQTIRIEPQIMIRNKTIRGKQHWLLGLAGMQHVDWRGLT